MTPHATLSQLLRQIAAEEMRTRVSVEDIFSVAGDRAFGALLFVFGLPNVIPTPPGTSTVLGVPLVLLAFQVFIGRRTPWLPRVIRCRSMARDDFRGILLRIEPFLRHMERVLKPRFSLVLSPLGERILGFVLLALAVILFLPIPFGNMLPAAAICLVSLSLIEHDGLMAAVGAVLGAVAVWVVWSALLAVLRAATFAFDYFWNLNS